MIRRVLLALAGTAVLAVVVLAGVVYWMLSGDGVRVALEAQASRRLGRPVSIGRARARLLPRPAIRLDGVSVGEPSRMTFGTVLVATDLRALLSRRIENAAITIADTTLTLPLALDGATSSTTEEGADAPALQLVSIRSVVLDEVTVVGRDRRLTLWAESSFVDSELRLQRLDVRTGITELNAEGVVQLQPRIDARLRVRAGRLDVDELLALAGAFAPGPDDTRHTAAPRVAARVSAETASAGGILVRQFATDLEVDGNRVSLSPLTFQLFGGRYQGAVRGSLGDVMTATIQSRLLDLDVAQLASFGNAGGTVSGRLTGAGTFSGRGQDMADLLESASGDGSATVTDGAIRGLNLVRTVVQFFGRTTPGSEAASDAFERLDASFSLQRGVVSADALSLRSRDADVVGHGTLALGTKQLDGRLDLSLSEALSSEAGTDFRRYTSDGNRIVLPARIGGTLDAPRLAVDAEAAMRRGLRNELERRMEGLLDRFRRPPAASGQQ